MGEGRRIRGPNPLSRTESRDDPLYGLVRAARAGDEDAFRRLVARTYRKIQRWALSRTGDPDDADEVCQRVLLRLHRHLDGWDGRAGFETWLYRITANVASSLRAENAREAAARERAAPHASRALDGPAGSLPDARAARWAPLDRLWVDDVADLVGSFFDELPPRQREVFDLSDLQGYAPAEIAEMLDMNPATVRANLFKARRTIRRRALASHPELGEGYGG